MYESLKLDRDAVLLSLLTESLETEVRMINDNLSIPTTIKIMNKFILNMS